MKKRVAIFILITSALFILAQLAFADVSQLLIRFAGGCTLENTGSCRVRVIATGSDLDEETAVLTSASSRSGPFRRVSSRARSLASGRTTFRFKNIPGACFRAITGPNGNDKPNRRSNIICEGESDSGDSSSSAGNTSSAASNASTTSSDDDSDSSESSRSLSSSDGGGSNSSDDDD